jgi:hypothetical protein
MTSNTTVVPQTKFWKANSISIGSGSVQPSSKTNENAGFTRASYRPVRLSVDDYRKLKQDGFIKVERLIPPEDIRGMSAHMDRVIEGIETAPGFPAIDPSLAEEERVAKFSRIHNAHRVHALHERFLLHPRILDVIEQLNGPDVLALQSMTFFKQPGQPGQGLVVLFLLSRHFLFSNIMYQGAHWTEGLELTYFPSGIIRILTTSPHCPTRS